MRRIRLAACCLGLLVVGVLAYAQPAAEKAPALAPKCPCPTCALAEGKAMVGVPEATILRDRMMLATQWDAYDPSGLLAIKADIKLTEEQTKSLGELANNVEAVVAKARGDAKALLTDEQLAKMDAVAKTPNTIVGLHAAMIGRTKGTE